MADRARPRPTPVDPASVPTRLHSAAIHLLRRARRVDTESQVPAPQLSALSVIVYAGPITLGALAAAEQVRPPTMTRLVAAMEAAALVRREPDGEDRPGASDSAAHPGRPTLEAPPHPPVGAPAPPTTLLMPRSPCGCRTD